ncbi:MAG: hypothetical protein IPI04_16290 [Ignavibacteria bacterium]|nr:hypothetical protein [Ignavibacteria bacterium]
MKKLIIYFTVLFLCSNLNLFAQVVSYSFRDSTGIYNEINGDTLAIATHTSQDPGNLNDVTYGPFALPYIFTFNCIDYTSYFVNTNGYITFGTTAPALANYGPISSSEVYEGAISAFGLNLIGVFGTTANTSTSSPVLTNVTNFKGVVVGAHITAATAIPADTYILAFNTTAGTITMSKAAAIPTTNLVIQIASGSIISKTEGISPNRVHTIQFKNFRQYIIIGTDDNFNFQIKLFESTMTRSGEIHIVYGNMDKNTIPVPIATGQVGLRGLDNTDWNNRTNSATLNWATSTPGLSNAATSVLSSIVFPVSGLTYIWNPQNTTVNITVIPQGFYNLSTLKLNKRDTVTAYLRNTSSPFSIVDSTKAVIDSITFTGSFYFKYCSSGTYYIEIKHRNSIETWSSSGVVINGGGVTNYNFTTAASKAYGNNMILKGTKYCIYSGDVNQDGIIDATDLSEVDNDAANSLSGYVRTDVTGDDFVDAEDVSIIDNNAYNSVSVIRP